MSYFSEWTKQVSDATDKGSYNQFAENYYKKETNAYRIILEGYPNLHLQGSAKELANRLEFDQDMIIFMGFLEGIQNSLHASLPLEEIDDNTDICLDIDYEQLYYDMHEAKAKWLYEISEWDNVLPKEKRDQIAKKYRIDHIAVRKKVGRNDPCHCGSGKKYKKCCASKDQMAQIEE